MHFLWNFRYYNFKAKFRICENTMTSQRYHWKIKQTTRIPIKLLITFRYDQYPFQLRREYQSWHVYLNKSVIITYCFNSVNYMYITWQVQDGTTGNIIVCTSFFLSMFKQYWQKKTRIKKIFAIKKLYIQTVIRINI